MPLGAVEGLAPVIPLPGAGRGVERRLKGKRTYSERSGKKLSGKLIAFFFATCYDSAMKYVEYNNNFGKAEKALREQAKQFSEQLRTELEVAAKNGCPVDSGELRDSIGSAVTESPGGFTVEVGTNADHAPAVEFGSMQTPAKPFMTPLGEVARKRMDQAGLEF